MATFKGHAVFWGVGNLTFTGFVGGDAQEGFCQSLTLNKTAEEKLIKNGEGNVVAAVHYNPMREVDFEIIPSDATAVGGSESADVNLHADSWMPAIGTVITIRDTRSTEVDTEPAGTGTTIGQYIVRSATLSRSNESEARVSITAFTSDAASGVNDLTTAIS